MFPVASGVADGFLVSTDSGQIVGEHACFMPAHRPCLYATDSSAAAKSLFLNLPHRPNGSTQRDNASLDRQWVWRRRSYHTLVCLIILQLYRNCSTFRFHSTSRCRSRPGLNRLPYSIIRANETGIAPFRFQSTGGVSQHISTLVACNQSQNPRFMPRHHFSSTRPFKLLDRAYRCLPPT